MRYEPFKEDENGASILEITLIFSSHLNSYESDEMSNRIS